MVTGTRIKAKPKLTLEQFLARPETKPASEYEDGEVTRKPMPSVLHGVIQSLLSAVFLRYLVAQPLGLAGSEIRCIFGPTGGRKRGYVPDFVVLRFTDAFWAPINGPFLGAPDLAVEILSPGDRLSRVRRRLRFCLENGVRLVWLIDPEDRTVMMMIDPFTVHYVTEEQTLTGGDVLPGFSVRVADLLPPPVAPPHGR